MKTFLSNADWHKQSLQIYSLLRAGRKSKIVKRKYFVAKILLRTFAYFPSFQINF